MAPSSDTQPHTPGQAVRAECRSCLDIRKGSPGFDCLDEGCPIYASQPWRGRDLPKSMQPPNGTLPEEVEQTKLLLREVPRRRATRKSIRLKCRQCLPERTGQPHCQVPDCELYALTPYQPGGQPKQNRSAKQIAAAEARGRANVRAGLLQAEPMA